MPAAPSLRPNSAILSAIKAWHSEREWTMAPEGFTVLSDTLGKGAWGVVRAGELRAAGRHTP